MNRSTPIDFLRGIAVILVLFSHHWIGINTLQHIGWIGVDLFFVLSGFLVSGLLFTESKQFGSIKPFHFLIRRGFKIYPLFYTSIFLTACYLFYKNFTVSEKLEKLLPEIFFLQNYIFGFWGHHWSLAVEEHFYILLSILLFLLVKFNQLKIFIPLSIFVFVFCLSMRIISSFYYPENAIFAQTHLRMDSLFFGVFIAYFYHFRRAELEEFFQRFKYYLLFPLFIPLIFTVSSPLDFFGKTFGLTLLYLSFGALLTLTLLSPKFVSILGRIPLYKQVAVIGFYSYSIYLFHMYFSVFIVGQTFTVGVPHEFSSWTVLSFLIFFVGSIIVGIVSSKLIEIPFLKLREKYFPRRKA